jgi:hypothetical protein
MNDIAVIQRKIYEIRGQKVILDRDLAALYQVETKVLNQAVKRNIDRFPEDFMFQLTLKEWREIAINEGVIDLKSQIVTSSSDVPTSQFVILSSILPRISNSNQGIYALYECGCRTSRSADNASGRMA